LPRNKILRKELVGFDRKYDRSDDCYTNVDVSYKEFLHNPCCKTCAQTRGHVRGVSNSPCKNDIIYYVVRLNGEQKQFFLHRSLRR